jgi:hypothetical protein
MAGPDVDHALRTCENGLRPEPTHLTVGHWFSSLFKRDHVALHAKALDPSRRFSVTLALSFEIFSPVWGKASLDGRR